MQSLDVRRVDGWLHKFTIAPQIGAGQKFFSRQVLRTFFMYANWSNGFRGLVGGVPYQNRTDGISFEFRRRRGGSGADVAEVRRA
jgi:maltoporin